MSSVLKTFQFLHKSAAHMSLAPSDQRLYISLPGYYNTSTCYSRNFKTLAGLCSWAGRFESCMVANPKDRFSRDEAHMAGNYETFCCVCWVVVIANWDIHEEMKTGTRKIEPSHEIMALFVLRKTHSSNGHAQPSRRARCLVFGRTLRLLPYFICANTEGSGETAQARLSLCWSPMW